MKKWQKILSLFVMLLICCKSNTYAEGIISMDVSPGYEGVMIHGSTVPVEIEIKSSGADIEGKIRVTYRNDDSETYVGSEVPIHLVDGSTKNFIVPLMLEQDVYTYQEDQFLLVEVFNRSGKLVSDKVVGVSKITHNQELNVGIHSNRYAGFTYFNLATIQLNSGETRSVNPIKMEAAHFSNPLFLEGVNVLVIDGLTAPMSDLGVSNIKQWIENGGTLLLSTGDQFGTQKQLAKALDISMIQELTVDFDGALKDMKRIPMTDSTFDNEISLEGVYSKSYGNGRILLSTYSLSSKQVVESPSNVGDITTIIQEGVVDNGLKRSMDKDDFRRIRNILNRVPREQMPSIEVIIMVVFMYILLVGPVGYFILKQKNLTTYYWRLVSGMALLATVIIFIAGRGIDFNKTIARGVTVIDQRDNKTQATSLLGIKHSGIGDVDIAINNGQIKWSGSYSYNEMLKSKTYYVEDNQQHILFSDVKKFQFVNMMIENKLDIKNAAQHIVLGKDATEVVITNPFDYALRDVAVVINGMTKYIRRIEANETATIEIEPTAFNQTGKRWNTYSFYDHLDPNMDELYEKNTIVEAFYNSTDNGYMNGNMTAIVFGFVVSDSTQSIVINNKETDVTGNSFWVDTLEIGQPKSGEVKMPFGSIVPDVSLQGETFYESYDQSYNGYGEAQFTFNMPVWLEASEAKILFDDRPGIVYKLYNNNSQEWEEVFFTDGSFEALLNKDQISGTNNIGLMVINNGGNTYYGPLLEVKGVVKND